MLVIGATLSASIVLTKQTSPGSDNIPTQQPTITPIPSPTTTPTVNYLIPVTSFTSLKSNLEFIDITESTIFLEESTPTSQLPAAVYKKTPQSEIITKIEMGEVVLIPLETLSPAYKILSIDGEFPLKLIKSEERKNYPFQYLTYEQEPLTNFDPKNIITIFSTGEIIPARAVDRLGLNKYNNYTYLYDWFSDELDQADISIGLLENPLFGNPVPCTGCMVFVGDEKNAQGMETVGFDLISLAGNHAGDAGQVGYQSTLDLFANTDIQITGIGNKEQEILKPAISEVNSQRFGLIAADEIALFYTNIGSGNYATNSFSAQLSRIERLTELKKEYNLDFLIIYMSWGVEYTNRANQQQVELAHRLIDVGADLIIASHPHWVQNIEIYRDVPIVYSQGNFIFDQTHTLATRQAFALNTYLFEDKVISLEILPLQTCGYHQTSTDLTSQYLAGEIDLEEAATVAESQGCIYWQPQQLAFDHPSYNQILERIYQYTDI